MIERLLAALDAASLELTPTEVAETLWLAEFLPEGAALWRSRPAREEPRPAVTEKISHPEPTVPRVQVPGETVPRPGPVRPKRGELGQAAGLYPPGDGQSPPNSPALTTRVPAVPALPGALDISRALRPLRWRGSSRREGILDEDATAEASAAAGNGNWLLRYAAAPNRWLDLALVVDAGPSMAVWQRTVVELRRVFERLGAFRDVRTWYAHPGGDGLALGPDSTRGTAARSPEELVDPTGRRLVLLVSDCVGPAWRSGELARWLELWGRSGPVAIVQPLPQRLWDRCAPEFFRAHVTADRAGVANTALDVRLRGTADPAPRGLAVPVLEPEASWLGPWAALVSGARRDGMWGAVVYTGAPLRPEQEEPGPEPSALERVAAFRATASPTAYELIRCLSATSLNLPVMRLVQNLMLPRSRPQHLAELLLGDLIRPAPGLTGGHLAEEVGYDFQPGVRDVLLETLNRRDRLYINTRVSEYVMTHLGSTLDFPALLAGAVSPGTIDDRSRPFATVTHTVLRSLGGRYTDIADQLAKALSESLNPPITENRDGDMTEQEPAAEQPAVWGSSIPPRNPNFTGRVELLVGLRDQLTSRTTALLPHALHGLGGVGKTQLAVEYVYRYASSYDLVWWVSAEQPALVRQSLAALAPKLGVAPSEDVTRTLEAVYDALRTGRPYRNWLLVFDNADQPTDLQQFLSIPGGHVLITSRNLSWTGFASTVEVDVFSREESVELLRRRLRTVSAEDAGRLAEALGDLPLALEQAATWQAATGTPVDEYLELLSERVGVLLSEGLPGNYPTPVAATWGVAFDRLNDRSPAAAQLLELCAFFGSEPISIRLVRAGRFASLPSPLDAVVRDDIALRGAIREIGKYGLAKVDAGRNSILIHRLVQAVLRDRLSPVERDAYLARAHELLAAASPGDPTDDPSDWPRHVELAPHVMQAGLIGSVSEEARQVVLDQIRFRYVRGDYESSRVLADTAYEDWRVRLGLDHQQTLVCGRHLANALRSVGLTGRAREVNREIHARALAALGPDHEHTLTIATSMGADLRHAGAWSEALARDEDTWERHKHTFGENDPNTLRAGNNLAVALRLLGRYRDSLEVEQAVVDGRREVLGPEHPDTLFSLSSLSRNLFGLGRFQEARDVQQPVLTSLRTRLGPDHANVLIATRIHSVTLRWLGSYEEAATIDEETLERYRRKYGDDHFNTISTMMSYANSLLLLDRLGESRDMGEDALARFRRLFGEHHPFVYVSMTNLAATLRALGDYAMGRRLDERALAGLRESLGDQHPHTQCAAVNHTNNLALNREYPVARDLGEATYARMLAAGGPRHAETLACAQNLAIDRRLTGDRNRARQLADETANLYRDVLGASHPVTQSAVSGKRAFILVEPPAL
ncbi:FxSxx-COOH system tetratricopeptide repeat protein [Longispora sp. NPDC051575]|uniref:FxSxx-COOH system tetratricopeptide repeat protein n=1 Tax=Longispora sp. NPDC051575 TaxID=3154943 RepID=UPI00341CD285